MAFEKPLPEWNATGERPDQEVIDDGYQPGDKPPAEWENWFRHTVYAAMQEIRSKVGSHISDEKNPHNVTKDQVGLGNVDDVQQIPMSQKGSDGGIAELNNSGIVPDSQLPDKASDGIVTGTYTGNNTDFSNEGDGGTKKITLGFRPSAIFIIPNHTSNPFNSNSIGAGYTFDRWTYDHGSGGSTYGINIVSDGFYVQSRVVYRVNAGRYGPRFNENGVQYQYIALR